MFQRLTLRDRKEWRTLALMLGGYGLYAGLQIQPFALPMWFYALLLIPLLTFHSSLQHEALHGHPFANQRLNDWLMMIPIGLLVPYLRFKDTHLKHHKNARLCDPYEDPESWYQSRPRWEPRSWLVRQLFFINNSLAGRMLLGPAISVFGLMITDFAAIRAGDRQTLRIWLIHLLLVGLLLGGIAALAGVSWMLVTVLCSYGGMSLLMVRTFLEHQLHESMRGRSVIIEDKGFFSLLFLNNNLHAVHHAYPATAWYELPNIFRKNRDKFLQLNFHYHFRNYAEIFRRYAFHRKESPVYSPSADNGQ